MRSSQQGVGSAVNVQILQGDILSSTRDAIVVPVSNNFQSGELGAAVTLEQKRFFVFVFMFRIQNARALLVRCMPSLDLLKDILVSKLEVSYQTIVLTFKMKQLFFTLSCRSFSTK